MHSQKETAVHVKAEQMATRALAATARRQTEAAEAYRRAFNARSDYETATQAAVCTLDVVEAFQGAEEAFDLACALHDQAAVAYQRIQ